MARIQIPVSILEFDSNSHTIWIQNPHGGTTLRIKTKGKIISEKCLNSPTSHADVIVDDDIRICLSEDILEQ